LKYSGGQISHTFECLNCSYVIGYPLRNGCHAVGSGNDEAQINSHFELAVLMQQSKSDLLVRIF